jgi:hypothetical protein
LRRIGFRLRRGGGVQLGLRGHTVTVGIGVGGERVGLRLLGIGGRLSCVGRVLRAFDRGGCFLSRDLRFLVGGDLADA